MGLIQSLAEFGFDTTAKSKIARHKDSRREVDWKTLRNSPIEFEEYQRWQAHPEFHGLDYLVSFVGITPRTAEFWGIYRVLGNKRVAQQHLPKQKLWPWRPMPHYKYDLEPVLAFESLRGRLIIEWKGERKWVQNLKDYGILSCPQAFDVDDEMWSAREGSVSEVLYLRTERNRAIVEKRKKRDKHTCKACGFQLKIEGKYIIDCHHLQPFDKAEERITKITDLVCLCPTCHRIAHIQRPPLKVSEIQQLRGLTKMTPDE